jgi:hypothetical protein
MIIGVDGEEVFRSTVDRFAYEEKVMGKSKGGVKEVLSVSVSWA